MTHREKICPRCKRMLPASSYHLDGYKSSGLSSYCRTCKNAYQRVHRKGVRQAARRQIHVESNGDRPLRVGDTCPTCRWHGATPGLGSPYCEVRDKVPTAMWMTVACPLWTPVVDDLDEMRLRASRCSSPMAVDQPEAADECGTMHQILKAAMERVGVSTGKAGEYGIYVVSQRGTTPDSSDSAPVNPDAATRSQ